MNKFTTTSLLQTSLLQRHKIMPHSTGNILMLARALYSKRIIVIILFGTKVPIPNIWGSPPLKFRLRPKMVRQNGAKKNFNARKIQTSGSRDFKYGLK